MTAGEIIAAADALRPNMYDMQRKLKWLQRLDGQVRRELLKTHEGDTDEEERPYDESRELLVPFPYGEELYLAYIFAQIDLNNAEMQKYNQSAALCAAAWRQYADSINRERRPLGKDKFRF